MTPGTHKSHIEGARADRNAWRFASIALVIANLIAISGWLMNSGNQRTLIVPTEIHKSFWIEDERVSEEYLEQMALYFTQLVLNVTPNTVDYQSDVFLRYVDPRAYGPMKTQLIIESGRVKRNSAAQAFFPREARFDTLRQRVAIKGDVITFVGEQKVKTASETWRTSFAIAGGKMSVTEFKKVNNDDPFETKKPVGAATSVAPEHVGG
jgi:conjugal transfer pilus assembly protein TraE